MRITLNSPFGSTLRTCRLCAQSCTSLRFLATWRPRVKVLQSSSVLLSCGHRKITIVDGKIGCQGGMNMEREQMSGMLWPHWRDTQIRMHGQAALALQRLFMAMRHVTPDMVALNRCKR